MTMKKLSTILLLGSLLLTACHTSRPPEEVFEIVGSCWTDDYEFFVCYNDTITHDDSLYLFVGGNLHEGGYGFALRMVTADTFIIQPIPGTPMVAVGVEGDSAVLSTDNGRLLLECYRPGDPERDTLKNYDPGDRDPKCVYEELLIQKRLGDIRGTYLDNKSGRTYQFDDTLLVRTPKEGKPDTATFHFFYAYDMPSHTLILSTNEQMWYELTPNGMDLFAVKYWRNEDDYSQEKLLCHLERIQ